MQLLRTVLSLFLETNSVPETGVMIITLLVLVSLVNRDRHRDNHSVSVSITRKQRQAF